VRCDWVIGGALVTPARIADADLGRVGLHRRCWEGSWSRSCCWMPLVAAGPRRRCLVTDAVSRRVIRGCATRLIHRRWRKSCWSCARPAIGRTGCDRGLIVVMWRAGLRISEALALTESDLDLDRGAVLVRHGKGDKRREVGMDAWGWELLRPWVAYRVQMPVGRLFCVIDGRTRGRPLTTTSVRQQLRRTAVKAGVRRRFAPHQLRHAHAVEMAREGVPLNVIQRQLGHANLGITSVYLQGIDNAEIIDAVHARRAPMIPASAGLRASR
jgi:integrase